MPRAQHIEDRMVVIDLRILVALHEAREEPIDLYFSSFATHVGSGQDRAEVLTRAFKLEREGFIAGTIADAAIYNASLDKRTRERLEEAGPDSNRTWIQRAKDVLTAIDTGGPLSNQLREVRDAILDRSQDVEIRSVDPDDVESLRAEMDLRIFMRLLNAQGGRAHVGPEHALGVRLKSVTLAETIDRIHDLLDRGWIRDGTKTEAGVQDASLAQCVRHGLAAWRKDRSVADAIRQLLEDDDVGRPIRLGQFVTLRDAAVTFC